MFFIFSKILHYAIQPVVVVCVLLLVSLLIKNARWRKITRVAGVSLLFFFSNQFIANEVISMWELQTRPYDELKKYEAAILLTGITSSNTNGPKDRVYFHLGVERVTHTIQLYKLGIVQKILVSGGSGKLIDDGTRESLLLREFMITMGVPDSAIYTDASSDNTYENAVESKKLIEKLGVRKEDCLLVTSAFHMRRALACFRKADLDIDYFTCDFRSHKRSFYPSTLFIPSLDAMHIWQKLLKEWTGFVAYKIAGYI